MKSQKIHDDLGEVFYVDVLLVGTFHVTTVAFGNGILVTSQEKEFSQTRTGE